MSVRIGEWLMLSDTTNARAIRTPDGWAVSWIPTRVFDRNQAITSMTIAEVYAENPPCGDQRWVHVRFWKAELGLGEEDRP